MRIIRISFLLLVICNYASAQIVKSYGNDFMNIGVTAKQLSMAKAGVSSVDGVEAGYWNPAGIITVKDFEFAGTHNNLYNGIGNYNYLGVALPVERDDVAVAFSLVRLSIDNIQNTTNIIDTNGNINYNNITTFNAIDVAAYLSLAKNFPKQHLRVGANAKIIRRNIGDFAYGNGFGFDIGAQYKLKKLKVGLMLKDITTTFVGWKINDSTIQKIQNADTQTIGNQDTPETIELTLPKFQLGLSFPFTFNETYRFNVATDLLGYFQQTNDLYSSSWLSFSPSIGTELIYKNVAFFRMGAGNFQNSVDFNQQKQLLFEPNVGMGFKYKNVFVDYALTNFGGTAGLTYSNVFSLKYKL